MHSNTINNMTEERTIKDIKSPPDFIIYTQISVMGKEKQTVKYIRYENKRTTTNNKNIQENV